MLRHPAHLQRGDIVHNLFCSFNYSFVHLFIHLLIYDKQQVPPLEWKYDRKKKNRQVPCSLGNYILVCLNLICIQQIIAQHAESIAKNTMCSAL